MNYHNNLNDHKLCQQLCDSVCYGAITRASIAYIGVPTIVISSSVVVLTVLDSTERSSDIGYSDSLSTTGLKFRSAEKAT